MVTFLIIMAVLVLILAVILSISATFTVIYDKGWHTTIKVLFFEKEIVLSEVLSFVLFPDKKGKDAAQSSKDKKDVKSKKQVDTIEKSSESTVTSAENKNAQGKPKKANPIKKLWDEEGIVGMLSFVSNLIETANSAILTLFRGLHIYSLYVMIIVGGYDADAIARSYGTLCKYYYPVKGIILNGMKVDNYDDYIQPDFIAQRTEFEMQFIGSINVALLLRVVIKAGFVFLKNFMKNKKGD